MRAVKANREYVVTEESKAAYIAQGFDILDDDGKVVECGKGKKVDYDVYASLKAENEELKTELESLKGMTSQGEEKSQAKTGRGASKKAGE